MSVPKDVAFFSNRGADPMDARTNDAVAEHQPECSLAVSLSGGGHRATLFALGALIYLVDAEANARVTSIASVSGGSLTNGFVGQTLDFRDADRGTFRKSVARPLATQIAKRGTLFAPILTKLYLVVLIVGAVLVFAPLVAASGPRYFRLLLFVLMLAVWGWLFGKRGLLCAHAFQRTLFSPAGRVTALGQLKKKNLDHVICATDLRAAEQVYFAGDFVYSYWLGHGQPADLALARAVQASAAFPGGFPPARLPTKRHGFSGAPTHGGGPPHPPNQMVMSDGGVYDNMADQWARGFEDRAKRWEELGRGRLPPKQLVVVNASGRIPWSPFRRGWFPLLGEVAALIRVNNVMYINTTNVRRQEIIDSYDPTRPHEASSLPSTLIQITQSPFVVAEAFARATGAAADRAKAVIAVLGKAKSEWAEIARENSRVPTTFKKLGVDVSARLIYQGYVVTMCNLHVMFGEEFPLNPSELDFKRFHELVA
jgi:hypothetical protein